MDGESQQATEQELCSGRDDKQSPDRDGLETSYDLVVLGTGLVQSIVSCVASKHGKKVLHLDKNDFYGEIYGSHSLTSHITYYQEMCTDGQKSAPESTVGKNSLKHTINLINSSTSDKYIPLFYENVSGGNAASSPLRRPWKSTACHPACFGYAMERDSGRAETDKMAHPLFNGYVKHNSLTKARAALRDREFNIDTTAKVLYGSCPMVDLMISSGVSNYLEFKTFEGLYFWLEEEKTRGDAAAGKIWKVPCSKGDVFNTTMIGALEKRALMKFHQFVADWGRINCGTEVKSLNENDVAVGMALYRPQNKQQVSGSYRVEQFLDRPFKDFLEDSKISPKLQRIIVYALCCHTAPLGGDTEPYLTRQALGDMFLHIDSIGKFGETAFLAPLYGSSEVVQAFCRMSAVWGGTFILKRSVGSVEIATADDASSDSAPIPASKPISEPPVPTRARARVSAVRDSEGNSIDCGAFVCGAAYWPDVPAKRRLKVSCTSVWLGAVVPLARSIIIIPATATPAGGDSKSSEAECSGSYAVHIIQTDSSTNAAPEGAVVLHMSTLMDVSASAAAAAEESLQGGSPLCWADLAKLEGGRAVELMNAVIEKLTTSFAEASQEIGSPPPEELSRVVSLQPVYDLDAPLPLSGVGEEGATVPWSASLPDNVRLCTECSDASLSMQAAYEEARDIFQQLFPSQDFSLNVVEETAGTEEALQHQRDAVSCENDDEMAYLEFTLNAATLPPRNKDVECGVASAERE